MKWTFSCLSLALVFSLVFLAGCGSKEPEKSSVTGRVFYRGGPMRGGAIVFVPDADRGNSGDLVKAAIRDDGTFSLDNNLVATGWYRVAIAAKPTTEPAVPTPANPYPGPPSRYRNPRLSGLMSEVRASMENVFEFQLDDSDR